MELAGGVALVTGGGGGMGRATAQRLAAEGMSVCVVDVNGDAAREAAEPIGALAVQADLSDSAQVDAVFARCVAELGGLDLVHLNAGVTIPGTDLAELTDEAYRFIVGVNQDHLVFGARAAIRALRSRPDTGRGGAIIVTSSAAGIDPFPPSPIYTMTKNAAVGFVRALGPTLAPEGIAVHAICPGLTDTAMISDTNREIFLAAGLKFITPDEIADAVVNAATAPIETSGTCWVINAGEAPVAHVFAMAPGPHTDLPPVTPQK